MSIETIAKLSDHAAVLTRERDAKGCVIIVLGMDDSISLGRFIRGATPADVQDALCSALYDNYRKASE